MRKFIVLKDTPEIKAGAIVSGPRFTNLAIYPKGYYFTDDKQKFAVETDSLFCLVSRETIENSPEWFKEIK